MSEFICCKHLKLNFVGKFFSILTTHDPFLAIWMQLITQRDNSQQKSSSQMHCLSEVLLPRWTWHLYFERSVLCLNNIHYSLCILSSWAVRNWVVISVGLSTSWWDRHWSFAETQHPIPLEKCRSKRCLEIVVSISTPIATFLFTTTYLKGQSLQGRHNFWCQKNSGGFSAKK